MSLYLVGDVHGCINELKALLEQVSFDPGYDQLWSVGDLVGRGPDSLAVLEFADSLGPSFQAVLGNHDLHLLAVLCGIKQEKSRDNVGAIVQSPKRDYWIDWLRQRPLFLAHNRASVVMAHAGVYPGWALSEAELLAAEVSEQLQGDHFRTLLESMYGNEPAVWSNNLQGAARSRFIINAFTRMRYCQKTADGFALDLIHKDTPQPGSEGLIPWFELRNDSALTIAFGHWASLNGTSSHPDVVALDTGCVWGNKLTLWDYDNNFFYQQNAVSS